jgi:hypothetical protein
VFIGLKTTADAVFSAETERDDLKSAQDLLLLSSHVPLISKAITDVSKAWDIVRGLF